MHASIYSYTHIPIYILYVGKVVSLEISEDSTCILYAGHSVKVERFADRPIALVDLPFLCQSKKWND